MNKVLITPFILILLLISSCDKKKEDPIINNDNNIPVIIGSNKYNIPLIFNYKEQNIDERIWKNINTKFQFKIESGGNSKLYAPSKIRTDSSNNIYILDFPDQSIKKFDSTGQFIKRIGRKGGGPDEFIAPLSFDVNKKGDLVVCDMSLIKCVVFTEDSTYILKPKINSSQVSFLSSSEIVTQQFLDISNFSSISKFNFTSNDVLDFQNFIDDKYSVGPISLLEGYLFNNKSKEIIYIPKYLNYFIIFSSKGEILHAHKTIDNIKIPTLERKSKDRGSFRVSEEFMSAFSSSLVGDKIIIISFQATEKYNVKVADYYSVDTGKYLFSTRLNGLEKCSFMHINKKYIYYSNAVGEVHVFSYKLL